MEILKDSILDELEKNDIEILKRTAGLDTLADDLQYSADNFVTTTQGFVDSFQAQFQTNKLERFIFHIKLNYNEIFLGTGVTLMIFF